MIQYPLLAPKHIDEFTPEEYKAYVQSLLDKPVKKEKVIRLKKQKPPFTWKLTKTGKLSITVNRKPKSLTRAEIEQIGTESGRSAEAWIYVGKKKIEIKD